ncbi:MAG: helix-turn-helix domain-containing protein [Eisenbergiella sp.]
MCQPSDGGGGNRYKQSYLSRIFHDETGRTITDYLNEIRIEAAKEMLAERYALKDIAVRSGFNNYTYFLKIFKDYTGRTPKEYLNESSEK